MQTDIEPLPVQVSPDEGESGAGFLLRVAHRNGASLGKVLSWLGLKSLYNPTPEALWLLSRATQVPTAWLAARLPIRRKHAHYQTVEWMRHGWTCALALRGKRPQICPMCLKEGVPCQAGWELTGVFACVRHRCLLQDRCDHCGQRLGWERPAPDVCRCGHYLTRGVMNTVESEALQWVSALLFKTIPDLPTGSACFATPAIPAWLDWLTPDGMFTLTYAAGLRERPSAHVAAQRGGVSLAPWEVAALIDRGLQRLRTLGSLDAPCPQELRCLLFDEALDRLAARGSTEADREIAGELQRWSSMVAGKTQPAATRRIHGQIDLFR